MIVVANKTGALGNRLFVMSHVLACGMEHGCTVASPAMDEYARYFRRLRGNPLCLYPPTSRSLLTPAPLRRAIYWGISRLAALLARLETEHRPWRVYRTGWEESLDLDDPAFVSAAREKPVVFLQGWLLRAEESIGRWGGAVRDFLTPDESVSHSAKAVLNTARASHAEEPVVGVHVRRGDYRDLHGGAYYYSLDEYGALIDRVRAAFRPEPVRIIVCSDQPLHPGSHPAFEDATFGVGDPIIDLFTLAECDYLVGPPSTFSMWASFYGNVPLNIVHDPRAEMSVDDFEVFDMTGYPSSIRATGPTYW